MFWRHADKDDDELLAQVAVPKAAVADDEDEEPPEEPPTEAQLNGQYAATNPLTPQPHHFLFFLFITIL